EHGDRGPYLVPLQVPHEMPGGALRDVGSLGTRLLDVVLTNVAKPGGERRRDGRRRKGLGDGNDADRGRIAAGSGGRLLDGSPGPGDAAGDVIRHATPPPPAPGPPRRAGGRSR